MSKHALKFNPSKRHPFCWDCTCGRYTGLTRLGHAEHVASLTLPPTEVTVDVKVRTGLDRIAQLANEIARQRNVGITISATCGCSLCVRARREAQQRIDDEAARARAARTEEIWSQYLDRSLSWSPTWNVNTSSSWNYTNGV